MPGGRCTLETLAASFSPDARGSSPVERFRVLRELGARAVPTWAALDTLPDGRTVVVVLERVARGGRHGDAEFADWVRDARRLATLEHPSVARIRDVVIRGNEVCVVSEYIDGVRWSEVSRQPQPASLEIAIRVLIDVLSGLGAVHNLRDAKREPLKLVHGELTPECVLLGLDGVARIAGTCRMRSAGARSERNGCAHLAPEVLLADETAGARADVYSVGVMLWEALSGRPLFPNMPPSTIVTHLLSGKVSRPILPKGSAWAEPLADVAMRALSTDPEKRFESAAAMAAELRGLAGPKLPPSVHVAAFVRATFGDRIQARRGELERGEAPVRRGSAVAEGAESGEARDSIEIAMEFSPATISTAPTPMPPSIEERAPAVTVPAAPRAPAFPTFATVPPPRPRWSTISGVAPPGSLDVDGPKTPVVVPASDRPPKPVSLPPTPMAALELPPYAPVPREGSTPSQAARPASAPSRIAVVAPALPTAASAFVASIDETPHPVDSRRGLVVKLLAGLLVLGVSGVVWWLVSGSSPATKTPPAGTATVGETAKVPDPPAARSVQPSTAPPATSLSGGATATAALPPRASPAVVGPRSVPPLLSAMPRAEGAPPPRAAPPVPRSAKPKYEPEGI